MLYFLVMVKVTHDIKGYKCNKLSHNKTLSIIWSKYFIM